MADEEWPEVYEVARTLVVCGKDADFRIELLRTGRAEKAVYKPRLYRQETVILQPACEKTGNGWTWNPKPQPMILWREYEMDFRATEDPEDALKMARAVIQQGRGR